MCIDSDMKIAGEKPSKSISVYENEKAQNVLDKKLVDSAEKAGKNVALNFLKDASDSAQSANDYELVLQRRLLLSFTATVGFEQFIANDSLVGIAQKSFLDTIKKQDKNVFASCSDTGAFSFYYLAYRRGSQTERRIGQTFAMLCSHDGDPIFEELGEALYCWFSSVVKKAVEEIENLT